MVDANATRRASAPADIEPDIGGSRPVRRGCGIAVNGASSAGECEFTRSVPFCLAHESSARTCAAGGLPMQEDRRHAGFGSSIPCLGTGIAIAASLQLLRFCRPHPAVAGTARADARNSTGPSIRYARRFSRGRSSMPAASFAVPDGPEPRHRDRPRSALARFTATATAARGFCQLSGCMKSATSRMTGSGMPTSQSAARPFAHPTPYLLSMLTTA